MSRVFPCNDHLSLDDSVPNHEYLWPLMESSASLFQLRWLDCREIDSDGGGPGNDRSPLKSRRENKRPYMILEAKKTRKRESAAITPLAEKRIASWVYFSCIAVTLFIRRIIGYPPSHVRYTSHLFVSTSRVPAWRSRRKLPGSVLCDFTSLNVLLIFVIIARLALHSRNIRNAIGASSGPGGLYTAIITMLASLLP
jgi:hypothetical protein